MGQPNRDFQYEARVFTRYGDGSLVYYYIIKCAAGAVHFHVTDHSGSDHEDMAKLEPSGGIEYHWRRPPRHMKRRAPSHENCPFLGGAPCWHDGSSMYATETLIPMWAARTSEMDMAYMLTHDAVRFQEDWLQERAEERLEEALDDE